MQETPAELRNAAARRLIQRGRFREALDVLNEAIRLDPRYAESFDNRAAVFERLGMYPQADADRRKVAALGGVRRPPPPAPGDRRSSQERRAVPPPDRTPPPPPAEEPEPDIVADVVESAPPPPEPTLVPEPVVVSADATIAEEIATEEVEATPVESVENPAHGRRRVVDPRYARVAAADAGGGGAFAMRGFGTLLIIMGLLTAAGIGIYLALTSIGDALNGDDGGFSPSDDPTATATVSAGASASPTQRPEDVDEALAGDPLSYSSFQAAWAARGITAETGDVADGFRGFGTTPVTVTLTKGGEEMEVSLLFYGSPAGPAADFDLSQSGISPKTGRILPSGSVGWYNVNVVAVIPNRDSAFYAEARDAFFAVSA